MRGENFLPRFFIPAFQGSPPHAWGKFCCVLADKLCKRLTPTCVGKIVKKSSEGGFDEAHPHMRGENFPAKYTAPIITGSPPHAWGKCLKVCKQWLCYGLTPTCVGKINVRTFMAAQSQAHPHMRGENRMGYKPFSFRWGSPPHAWGKL